jgi:CBS domain-containing protein
MLVENLMTREVATVMPEASLKGAAAVLAQQHVSGLPVIDGNRVVVGVLSESDIVYRETGGSDGARFVRSLTLPKDQPDRKAQATTVRDAMSSPAITIDPGQTIEKAARIMVNNSVRRLPVVDAEGHLLGILAEADLVRAFIRSDDELAREVREDVIERRLWLDPASIDVDVHDGEVELSGQVETRADAQLVPRLVEQVPGVMRVLSKLSWREDEG